MLVYLKYYDCFAQVVRLVLICRWSTCCLGYCCDIRTGVASNWGYDGLYSRHAYDDDLCSTSQACRLSLLGFLLLAAYVAIIVEQFPGSTSSHVGGRSAEYENHALWFYITMLLLILLDSLIFTFLSELWVGDHCISCTVEHCSEQCNYCWSFGRNTLLWQASCWWKSRGKYWQQDSSHVSGLEKQ